jgi:hypothetical protein
MAEFKRLNLDVDVSRLRDSLITQPELFGKHSSRACAGSPHTQMTDVWVRYNHIDNLSNPATFHDEHNAVWYPDSEKIPDATNIAFEIMHHVRGERLGGVLITKLPPGGRIEPHSDRGYWHAEFYEKYYVPIQNDPGCVFGFIDGDIIASPGQVHWFSNYNAHWVKNDSTQDRLAMIVCIKTETKFGRS